MLNVTAPICLSQLMALNSSADAGLFNNAASPKYKQREDIIFKKS
jgi:hypothetical protein